MKLVRKSYETNSEKVGDFFLGVGLCIAVNVGLYVVSLLAASVADPLIYGVGVLALLVNVGGLIFLGLTRRWAAVGALIALVLPFLLVLCLVVTCFSSGW